MTYTEEELKKINYVPLTEQEIKDACRQLRTIANNVETMILGKKEVVDLVIATMIAGGHALIEDIPGVGKTSLATALAKSVDCEFKRIQFTPDVMPSDVAGFSVYSQKTGEFEFRPGAAMSNIVLADEINRAPAKTQSAMLEIMEERQVTVDSHTYYMDTPYMVLATQNPIDQMGTYQLPEAQIDRFMVKFSIGYPGFTNEVNIVMGGDIARTTILPVVSKEDIRTIMAASQRVVVTELLASYIVAIVDATRNSTDIRIGSSPRGSISLNKLSRTWALIQGRGYVIPEDIKYLAPFVLSHRIILSQSAQTGKRDPKDIIDNIVRDIVIPTEPKGRQA